VHTTELSIPATDSVR